MCIVCRLLNCLFIFVCLTQEETEDSGEAGETAKEGGEETTPAEGEPQTIAEEEEPTEAAPPAEEQTEAS